MLGKTFKGLTDVMLDWQTREFLARESRRDESTVYVRPEIVVEIAFSDLQASPRYPGGLALRLARVKRYRPDKRVEEADTMAIGAQDLRGAVGLPAGDQRVALVRTLAGLIRTQGILAARGTRASHTAAHGKGITLAAHGGEPDQR